MLNADLFYNAVAYLYCINLSTKKIIIYLVKLCYLFYVIKLINLSTFIIN